jgi:CubicO group peptidase (beta-lactamase class C family)
MKQIYRTAIAMTLLLLLTACQNRYTYTLPEHTKDGWQTADLHDFDIDGKRLTKLVNRIRRGKIQNIHSVLLVKEGNLVFEEYFEGHRFAYDKEQFRGQPIRYDRSTMHNTMSVTKAVTAAVVGIGIDRGLIESEQQVVSTLLPAYSELFDGYKKEITIEHLLTMSSGLLWNEWDVPLSNTKNDLIQLFIVADPVEYISSKPLAHPPGSYWYYSGGDVNLLGVVFEAATGRKVDEFSAEHLFSPLGITDFRWSYINNMILYASGELFLRPRDMAKFGYLYLNDGRWKGKQIISKAWIAKSLSPHISTNGRAREGASYGYQWWQKTFPIEKESIPAFVRSGWGGQMILLFPSIDVVVVFTGGNYSGTDPVLDLVTSFVLPALRN